MSCIWNQDSDGIWHTACNHLFEINDGTPLENDMVFCCYCGKTLQEMPHNEDEE